MDQALNEDGMSSHGTAVVRLLDPDRPNFPTHELERESRMHNSAMSHGGKVYGEFLSRYLLCLKARSQSDSVRELELMCTCLKTWIIWYIEADGDGMWMTPMMIHLSVMARRVATQLDQAKRTESNSDQYLKKLVEVQREMFQKLTREKGRRPGYVWVCCELLRAYFRLGQVNQCSFLLRSVESGISKDGFNPADLPKAISVSFYFFWGKHCVFDHNLMEADKKLTWAFNHCPSKGPIHHRRKILLYLVPCKLRLGVLPSQELLQKYNLHMFTGIVSAIREGNARLFSEKMEEHSADFIKMGTYLLMMKLKCMVLRSLVKGVHREERLRRKDDSLNKLDLASFEHVFAWQDTCDADETACVLSNLIYQGAVKGYLSHEHKKLVFAKDNPFPQPSKWKM